MLRRNQEGLKIANILSDMLLLIISCFFSRGLRFNVLEGKRSMSASAGTMLLLILVFSVVCVFCLYLSNLYSPQRLRKAGGNTFRIFLSNGFCALLLLSVLFVFRIINMSRLAVGINWLLSSVLISLKHILLHVFLHQMRIRGYNLRHYVMIGNGQQAHQYLQNVRDNPFTGVVVDGYISAVEKPELGRCLGSYEDLESVLKANDYDGLVVALEPHEIRFLKGIMDAADKVGIQIDLIPFFNDYFPTNPTFEQIGSTKLIDLRATPLNRTGNAAFKRLIDICASLFLLVLLSPLLLVTAVGVRLSSPGPAIFRQERIGKNKKPFRMYKFRSMRVTGTEETGWSKDRDPRKTKFGSLIRKFSIDELPQLWNVLKGDMSLIGPRPEIPFHVDHFKDEVPRYLVRQQVRPGMTGWAQVNGFRGDTDIVERVQYDIWYIENWSLSLDLFILLKTLFGAFINSEKI